MAFLVLDPYLSIYEFQSHSTRGAPSVLDTPGQVDAGAKWDYTTRWSFHPKETVSFLYPYFYGLQSAAYWGYMSFTQSTHYLGLLMIFFIIPGLWGSRRRTVLPMAIVSLLILITGFGHYFSVMFKTLYQLAPMFDKFRVPSMIYALLPISLGVVTSQGLENLMYLPERGKKGDSQKLVKTLLIILGLILGVSLLSLFIGDGLLSTEMFSKAGQEIPKSYLDRLKATRLDLFNKGMLLSLLVAGGSIGALLLRRKKIIKAGSFGIMFILLLVIDLGIVDMEFLNLKSATSLTKQYRINNEIRFLKKDKSLYRVLPLHSLNTNWYGYYGISSISGYRPVKLRTYQDIMDASSLNVLGQSNSNVPFSYKLEVLKVRKPILDMLNVKYIISGQSLEPFFKQTAKNPNIYENLNVLPRAWIVHRIKPVETQAQSLSATLTNGFDPSDEAIVVGFDLKATEVDGIDQVKITYYSENELRMKIFSETGGLLVLSENYYEPGWLAEVDGVETPIYQTNHVLRSVYIPSGDHSVKFVYNDSTFKNARLISRTALISTILSIGIILGLPLIRRSKQ
jgi:hypothetical protein